MVRKLDFEVDEFVRVTWVSNEARKVWEPRVSAVSRMFQELEITAVHAGIKPATLQICNPDDFLNLSYKAAQIGLVALPLDKVNLVDAYSNATKTFDPNRKWGYRSVVARDDIARQMSLAWKESDHVAIGGLLGFPLCCRQFFQDYWVNKGWRDLTYPMVMNEADDKNSFHVDGSISCNILLRWVGIRCVSHLPCSFNCDSTKSIGNRMLSLSRDLWPQETIYLTEMLNWPIRYSSLHGIAIITTPVLRIVTSTDPLAEKITIDRDGKTYPEEGATGLEFPFIKRSPLKFKMTPTWKDDGFVTEEARDVAHAVVLKCFENEININEIENVIDLGSGSGSLLEEINKIIPTQLYGIEMNAARFKRSAARISQDWLILFNMDIYDFSWMGHYGVALISINRLTEVNKEKRDKLLETISRTTKYLIIYSYDGKVLFTPDRFKFVKQESEGSTSAILLRSINVDSQDKTSGL